MGTVSKGKKKEFTGVESIPHVKQTYGKKLVGYFLRENPYIS
jgi:hypothetical protein